MQRTNLSGAQLQNASLIRANLTYVDLDTA